MKDLIEQTGYSYSGVVDLIRNSDDNKGNTLELLKQIDKEYNDAIALQLEYEKLLEKAKTTRGYMVSMFVHCMNVLDIKQDKPLVFLNQNEDVVVVKLLSIEECRIDYEKHSVTDLSLNDESEAMHLN